MRDVARDHGGQSRPALTLSRRGAMVFGAKLATGATLSMSAVAHLAPGAAADHTEIVLTAATAEIGAKPGVAFVQGEEVMRTADPDVGAMTQIPLQSLDAPLNEDTLAEEISDLLDEARGTRGRGP